MNSAPDIYISLHNTVLEDLVNKPSNKKEDSREESLVIGVLKQARLTDHWRECNLNWS